MVDSNFQSDQSSLTRIGHKIVFINKFPFYIVLWNGGKAQAPSHTVGRAMGGAAEGA